MHSFTGSSGFPRRRSFATSPQWGALERAGAFVRSPRLGFTLLETLLVLALIGLLASVLIGGAAGLLNDKPRTPDEVFWSAVQEARKMALKSERDVTLRFIEDKDHGKGFLVAGPDGTKLVPVPVPGDLEVTFLTQQKGGTLIMIAGTAVETQKIDHVVFYADGTCSPFRVQFLQGNSTHQDSIDPWTCAPVLTSTSSTGGPS